MKTIDKSVLRELALTSGAEVKRTAGWNDIDPILFGYGLRCIQLGLQLAGAQAREHQVNGVANHYVRDTEIMELMNRVREDLEEVEG